MNKGGQDCNSNLSKYSFTIAYIVCPHTSHTEVLGCGNLENTLIGRKENYKCLCYVIGYTGLGVKFVLGASYRNSRGMTFQSS